MESDISTEQPAVSASAQTEPAPTASQRPARRGGLFWPVALFAFVALVLLAGWLAITGKLDFLLPSLRGDASPAATASAPAVPVPVPMMTAPYGEAQAPVQTPQVQASMLVGGVETRLALLEERLSRIDQQAHAASGNAARAEGLLVAFAVRRVLAKGGQLGYLEDQLRLRFGGAQPEAVAAVIAFGKEPVTIDQLASGLDTLAPGATANENGWDWLRREVSSLFVVRRSAGGPLDPRGRIERARLMLIAGKTAAAIDEVGRLPATDRTAAWISGARRYESAQHALDVIETAAMLEPRRLHDADGRPVTQTSPLAPTADAAPSATPVAQ